MKNTDPAVARALLVAHDAGVGYARLSKPQISARTGISTSTVRASLSRLVDARYFVAIAPTSRELADGDFVVKYQPRFAAAVPSA